MEKISETGGEGSSWDYCKAFQIQRCVWCLLAALAIGCREAAYHSPMRMCVSKQLTSILMASKAYLRHYFFLLFFFFLSYSEIFAVIPQLSAAQIVFSFSQFTQSDLDTAKYVLISKVQTQQNSNISLKA